MSDIYIPQYTIDLIKQLDEQYPKITPKPGVSREKELYEAGQRSVVDRLKAILEDQEEEEHQPISRGITLDDL